MYSGLRLITRQVLCGIHNTHKALKFFSRLFCICLPFRGTRKANPILDFKLIFLFIQILSYRYANKFRMQVYNELCNEVASLNIKTFGKKVRRGR